MLLFAHMIPETYEASSILYISVNKIKTILENYVCVENNTSVRLQTNWSFSCSTVELPRTCVFPKKVIQWGGGSKMAFVSNAASDKSVRLFFCRVPHLFIFSLFLFVCLYTHLFIYLFIC